MKILVVGSYLEDHLVEKFNILSKESAIISVASIKYTKMIYDGFCANPEDDVEQIWLAPIGAYPHCKKILWKDRLINKYAYLKFINIIFIKQFLIFIDLFYFILKWYFKNRKDRTVVVFTFIYLPFLIAVAPLKVFTKLKFVSFVPDLPEYGFSYSKNGGILKKIFVPIYLYFTKNLISFNDYFVFITKYMKDLFPEKPFTVIEGLSAIASFGDAQKKSSNKTIMYSGALFEKFGIKTLLQAFMKIDGQYELWLFGSGDMADEIKEVAKQDFRIKYFGQKPNTEILKYLKKATLLINPRFSHEEFTKYSFPSKLMEYLSSGTAVISTKLPGIPDDYLDKFYFIEDESVDGFISTLQHCLQKEKDELDRFGEKGMQFVLKEKNYIAQIKNLRTNLHLYFKDYG